MVEFTDGVDDRPAVSMPDMRLPIGYALGLPRPDRHAVRAHRLGRRSAGSTSSRPTSTTFRCLGLAYEAGRVGGTAPAWLSAANEVAVEAFLAGRIRWDQIAEVCNAVLDRHDLVVPPTVGRRRDRPIDAGQRRSPDSELARISER